MALSAVVALGGRPDAATGTSARSGGYRIVLTSDLDRVPRGYTIRLDGSQLTPLLSPKRKLIPFAVSRSGRTIAYREYEMPGSIYVSRGNGTRLHRVTRDRVSYQALSPDGRMVAYAFGPRGAIAVVRTDGRARRVLPAFQADEMDWSPDGKTLVYRSWNAKGVPAVVIQPLRGHRRVLARKASTPKWSPDGRWITYSGVNGLWLVRPDGQGRHRLGLDGHFDWSADGRSLAVATGRGIAFVRANGRVSSRIRLPGFLDVWKLLWAPGGRSLFIERSEPHQIWVVGVRGRGLRRVTHFGNNFLLGWTWLVPTRRPVRPLPPSVRVIGPTTVVTDRPIRVLSADGDHVAFPAEATAADCGHVAVWTPATKALGRFFTPAKCRWPTESVIYDLELAGSRAAWATQSQCGNACDDDLYASQLGARSSEHLAFGNSDNGDPPLDFHVHGHGGVLVFNDRSRLVQIGSGRERCQERGGLDSVCTTLRRGAHSGLVDSVSGGLIAVREDEAAAILDDHGRLVRVFPLGAGEINAARLDGGRLAVARAGAIEVYDVSTGAGVLQRPLPARFRLVDVDGGIAVLLRNNIVMLLRLEDGRSVTLTPGRSPVLAELEAPGLYYSYGTRDDHGRVVFMPRAEILQKLGG
jgi:hypothetical protein